METEHEEWLKLTVEDAIDPELPICDAHHHLRERPDDCYLLKELLQDTGDGHNIVQTVCVCGPTSTPVADTAFIDGIANESASGQYGITKVAAGIVGVADLSLGAAVAPILEAHMMASKDRFRGIRYSLDWHPNAEVRDYMETMLHIKLTPGLMADPKVREGFACLQRYGLSFDAILLHTQLPELADLARDFPGTPIILDHIGCILGIGPYTGKRQEVLQEWKRDIAELATCPNVFIKLGGLGMPLFGFGWQERTTPPSSAELAETMAPYYCWCIEKFGVDRCMFESNFPVDRVSYSYTIVWNAFKRITQDFSLQERTALFHDTATRVYKLL